MMMVRLPEFLMGVLSAAFFVLALAVLPARASDQQQAFSLYGIAIGSSYYASPPDADSRGMATISGANRSAREVANRLVAGGARLTILLTSDPRGLIAVEDVDAALAKVEAQIAADKPANPLIVFYIASHGISEGVGWSHFSVPGTFLYKGPLSSQNVEALSTATLYAGTLAERLQRSGARYLLILDSCYEGNAADFDSPLLSGPAIDSLKSVADILRVVNEFRQRDPVVFSTAPGTLASTVDDPYQPAATPLAPLARRLMLILDQAVRTKASISLDEVVEGLTSPMLDGGTQPAVTHAVRDRTWSAKLLAYDGANLAVEKRLEERQGSARAGIVCCERNAVADLAESTVSMPATVQIAGVPGEFITDGRSIRYAGEVTVTQEGTQALTFTFEEDGDSWEISLAAPEHRRLSKGVYAAAVRYPFATENEPSMAILGPGRACNESTGRFTIRQVNFGTKGELLSIDATFRQFCDHSKSPLDGSIVIK